MPYASAEIKATSPGATLIDPSSRYIDESRLFPFEAYISITECFTVNVTEPDFVSSSTLVAVIVTVLSSVTFFNVTAPFLTVATVSSLDAQVTFLLYSFVESIGVTVAERLIIEPSKTVVSSKFLIVTL